ncbi:SDR family NAD(P)-dependent oxidoreductase [Gordonia sp. ABSL1-1]|uniref:SDR family NAD(P)-dependent oxidoreductase n=1 Tax=Gordonia sp. ABSL1-1 TaxID=3053923 RepID=UPI0025746A14|nr:SDR family NAD(P)-dependent oxidoreductase [Gordonia sp. ABSL1-1]MDL9938625.1 SDR family NAD(P)-dependent oxidoreductase [Gordonia sp. ABSL1-1]
MTAALQGRTALVIGANGEIGRAVARALGVAGAQLILAGRDRSALAVTGAELDAQGIMYSIVSVDITDDDSVAGLVGYARRNGLDIAVNNAGLTHQPAPLAELSLDDIDRVLRVTLRGTLVAMRHELAALPAGGSVVNVASTAGLAGAPGMAAYVAAKHGVVGLTRTAALDYAERGIRVNAVAPGSVDSGAISRLNGEVKERIGSMAPIPRLGRPAEVAAAVTWLASPASSFTTGTVLTVDGGKGARGA